MVVTTSRFEIRNTAVFKTQSQKHAKLFFRYNRFPHFWGSRVNPNPPLNAEHKAPVASANLEIVKTAKKNRSSRESASISSRRAVEDSEVTASETKQVASHEASVKQIEPTAGLNSVAEATQFTVPLVESVEAKTTQVSRSVPQAKEKSSKKQQKLRKAG